MTSANSKNDMEKASGELSGKAVSISKLSRKEIVLKELEAAFAEAKDVRDGKKQGLTIDQILSA